MTVFRLFLIVVWLVLAVYTSVVVASHGFGLLPIFFGDMLEIAWPGQFNLDFMLMLALSALWVAWRNGFSGIGLALAALAFSGGAGFLYPYLLFVSIQSKGDINDMLLGRQKKTV